MLSFTFLLLLATVVYQETSAFPRYYRSRRSPEGEIKYAPCKNVYPQCPEWKGAGWCENPEYKDYMATVCPVTCEYCRETNTEATLDEIIPLKAKSTTPLAATPQVATTQAAYNPTQESTDYNAQVQKYYENVAHPSLDYVNNPQRSDQPTTPIVDTPTPTYSAYNPSPSYDSSTHAAQYAAAPVADPAQYQAAAVPSPVQAQDAYQQVAPAATAPVNSQPLPIQQAQPQPAPEPVQTPQASATNTTNQQDKSKDTKQSETANSSKEENKPSNNPQKTSSALYSEKKKEVDNSAALNLKEGEPEDDATNEKNVTESKHLEKSLQKIGEPEKPKKSSRKKKKSHSYKKADTQKSDTTLNDTGSSGEEQLPTDEEGESEKEDGDDELVGAEGHNVNREDDKIETAKTFAKEDKQEKADKNYSVDGPSPSPVNTKETGKKKGRNNNHVEKSESAANNKIKEKDLLKKTSRSEQPSFMSRHVENEASLRGDDDTNESASESESESGSGNVGEIEDALSKDLEELSFITGLNFDEEDYDVADDISNELLNIESQKHQQNKAALRNIARSEIDVGDVNINKKALNNNPANTIIRSKTVTGNKKDIIDNGVKTTLLDSKTSELNVKSKVQDARSKVEEPSNIIKIVHARNEIEASKPVKVETKTLQLTIGGNHARSEIPQDGSQVSIVTSITDDESSSESGESESGESENESGSGENNEAKESNDVKVSEQKTLLESMHKSGDLKAFAVEHSNVKKSTTEVSKVVKESPKESSSDNSGSGAESGSGDSNDISAENNDLMESSGNEGSPFVETNARDVTPSLEEDDDNENSASTREGASEPTKPQDPKKMASDFLPAELLEHDDIKAKVEKVKVNKVKTKVKAKGEGKQKEIEMEILPGSKEERKEKEQQEFGSGEKQTSGKLSVVLKQNFNDQYLNSKSTNYQMLAGNIKKDFEKMLIGAKLKDISFSEATIEGNPRQTGKTRVTFSLDGSNESVMKLLLNLVDEGNVNGLAIVKSSLETDEE